MPQDLERGDEQTITENPPQLLEVNTPTTDVQQGNTDGENEILVVPDTVETGPASVEPIEFEVVREGYTDNDGRQWSMELKPFNESREDCQKRIKQDLDELMVKFGKGPPSL